MQILFLIRHLFALTEEEITRFTKFFTIFQDKTHIDVISKDEVNIFSIMIKKEFLQYLEFLKGVREISDNKKIYEIFMSEIKKFQEFIESFFVETEKKAVDTDILPEFAFEIVNSKKISPKTENKRELAMYFIAEAVLNIKNILIGKTDEIIKKIFEDRVDETEIIKTYYEMMTDYAKNLDYEEFYGKIKADFVEKVKVH